MQGIGSSQLPHPPEISTRVLKPFQRFLPAAQIRKWCRQARHGWRQRKWSPALTLWATVRKQCTLDSARQIEDWQALSTAEQRSSSRDGHTFCAARARLPLVVMQKAVRHVAAQASAQGPRIWHGWHVYLSDGTTVDLPRTAANAQAFGRSANQAGPSRFPLLRLVLLVCAGSGACLNLAFGPYAVGEMRLFLLLLLHLPSGGVLVADRLYGNFTTRSGTLRRGSHALCRCHVNRRENRVRRLGQGDEIHRWHKPRPVHVACPTFLKLLPASLEVRVITGILQRRGFRDKKLILVTTLLNPKIYPAADCLDLYLERWPVEGYIRSLKLAHGLQHLTTHTPQTVCREVYAAVLAYNLVRASLAASGQNPQRLSHTRACSLLIAASERMVEAAPQRQTFLCQRLLCLLAQTYVPAQTRPPEPRAVVQQRRRFPFLKISRTAWRNTYYVA